MKRDDRHFNRLLGQRLRRALSRHGWRLHRYEDGDADWMSRGGTMVEYAFLRDLFICLVASYKPGAA